MKIAAYIPTIPQLSREVICTLAGVVIAALIISQFPSIKQFVKDNRP
jgi:hypothetical protein